MSIIRSNNTVLAYHLKSSQSILEDLLKSKRFENSFINCWMKAKTSFEWSKYTVYIVNVNNKQQYNKIISETNGQSNTTYDESTVVVIITITLKIPLSTPYWSEDCLDHPSSSRERKWSSPALSLLKTLACRILPFLCQQKWV